MTQLKTLRARITAHPNDDVALTQLGDMYTTVNKFAEAIPLYKRALKANPNNVAAQEGLKQAGLKPTCRSSGGARPSGRRQARRRC